MEQQADLSSRVSSRPRRSSRRPRVVVGVGESPSGGAALEHALGLCRRRGWALDVVTAWPDVGEVLVHDVPGHYCEPRARAARAQRAALEARGAVSDPLVTVHLVNDDPVRALTSAAHGAEMLVVGTPADGRSRRRGFESVGEACRLRCDCPVVEVDAAETRQRRTA